MTAPTHIVFGLFSASSLFSLLSTSLHKDLPAVGLVTLGSLLPDIDTPGSSVGRLLPFISMPIERRWGHRTITHGFLCLAGLGALASPLLLTRPSWFAALLIGYGSHLFADSMTKSGVPLFYPSSAVCVLPANSRYRFKTGALSERIFFVGLLLLLMLVFPISKMGGTWRALRYLMATQSMAYTEFREAKTEAVLDFKGRWRQSRKPVSGKAVILDGNKSKLLIAFDGQTWLYGEQGDILPDRSRVRYSKRPRAAGYRHRRSRVVRAHPRANRQRRFRLRQSGRKPAVRAARPAAGAALQARHPQGHPHPADLRPHDHSPDPAAAAPTPDRSRPRGPAAAAVDRTAGRVDVAANPPPARAFRPPAPGPGRRRS